MNIETYQGIPNALEFIPYANAYYDEVQNKTIEQYGSNATILDAVKAMNDTGNLTFFEKIPELYGVTKEELGKFYQPKFKILNDNHLIDFLHGVSHIRSKSEHTLLGEIMLSLDQYYSIGMNYDSLYQQESPKDLSEFKQTPFEICDFRNMKFPYQALILMNVRKVAIQRELVTKAYRLTYKPDKYLAELYFDKYPDAKKLSNNFHKNPLNPIEVRASQNLVRAVFMDEKFKLLSSLKSSFIQTPINTSISEKYNLIFTNQEEESWLEKLNAMLLNKEAKTEFASLINTTSNKSSYPQKIAAETAKVMTRFYC